MASKKLLEILPKNLIHPLLGFTYLTPTYTLLNNLDTTINPSFSLFLFGKTEYGKTTLSSIMLSHFGKDFSPKSPPASFDDTMHSVIERFSNSENMWLNRSAILFQLSYKDKTNFEILKSECEKHKRSNEFFIQKAIGWALRDYSRFNPNGVEAYVNSTHFKPLSRREALRLL